MSQSSLRPVAGRRSKHQRFRASVDSNKKALDLSRRVAAFLMMSVLNLKGETRSSRASRITP